ncbi:unnamed protein product [Tenebrio molitor]|nr:unnamed protein product [Tenebrio molitor]
MFTCPRSSGTKNIESKSRGTGSGICTSVLLEKQTLWLFVSLRGVLVVVDGFAHEWVWVFSRILKDGRI